MDDKLTALTLLKASVSPKMGSGGPSGTLANVEAQARAPTCCCGCCCLRPPATLRRTPRHIIESAMVAPCVVVLCCVQA